MLCQVLLLPTPIDTPPPRHYPDGTLTVKTELLLQVALEWLFHNLRIMIGPVTGLPRMEG
jgi:hypothetical protein